MSTTSKSPRRVLQVAYAVAQKALPAYSHRCSPKKFTQHQLFAILTLKAFLKTDYRGVVAMLADTPSWCAVIRLREVPHFTTIEKAEKRLLRSSCAAALLAETVELGVRSRLIRRRVALAAMDGTGFESHHISAYFVRRRGKKWGEEMGISPIICIPGDFLRVLRVLRGEKESKPRSTRRARRGRAEIGGGSL